MGGKLPLGSFIDTADEITPPCRSTSVHAYRGPGLLHLGQQDCGSPCSLEASSRRD